jgi:hypothetical protein
MDWITDVCRFYQLTVALEKLGKAREPPILRHEAEELRNNYGSHGCAFLDHLALMCDSDKDGSTVTAIGLGDPKGKPILWVACNDDIQTGKVVEFLSGVMKKLKDIHMASKRGLDNDLERLQVGFIEDCLKFVEKRLSKEISKLRAAIKSFREKNNGSIIQLILQAFFHMLTAYKTL